MNKAQCQGNHFFRVCIFSSRGVHMLFWRCAHPKLKCLHALLKCTYALLEECICFTWDERILHSRCVCMLSCSMHAPCDCIHAPIKGTVPGMFYKLAQLDQQKFLLEKNCQIGRTSQNVCFNRVAGKFLKMAKLGINKTLFLQWNMETLRTILECSWVTISDLLGEPPRLCRHLRLLLGFNTRLQFWINILLFR